MIARVRKPTARCPAVGASTAVVFSVSVSFFRLVVVFFVFWVLVWVSVCSILTWNVPNLLCRAKTPWSCRNGEGGSHACRRGEGVQLEAPRLRMWFNGWLCDLAAAACGRGKLHVRLLWPGTQGQSLSAGCAQERRDKCRRGVHAARRRGETSGHLSIESVSAEEEQKRAQQSGCRPPSDHLAAFRNE